MSRSKGKSGQRPYSNSTLGIAIKHEPEIVADLDRLSEHFHQQHGIWILRGTIAREALRLGILAMLVKNGLTSAKRGRPSEVEQKVRNAAKEATEELTLMELKPKVNSG